MDKRQGLVVSDCPSFEFSVVGQVVVQGSVQVLPSLYTAPAGENDEIDIHHFVLLPLLLGPVASCSRPSKFPFPVD
jgi:hypothetical protein